MVAIGSHASSDLVADDPKRRIYTNVARIDGELECVRYERRPGAVTVQLALGDKLAPPMTVDEANFFGWPSEEEQIRWLKRQTQGLLDIYGDARDGRVLSDQEVLDRANASG